MKMRVSFWSVVLAIGLTTAGLVLTPGQAVGRDSSPPAETLPGPDCIWFMWVWWGGGDHYGPGQSGSSDSSANGDEGEDMFDEYYRSEKNPTW